MYHNLYVFNVLNLVIFLMCADETHIDLLVDENHHGHYPIVVALDVEHKDKHNIRYNQIFFGKF